MKKRKKLKTIGKLKSEADRAMQNYFRTIKTQCELCPNSYQVAHHFIWKSQSNYLRYDEKNLIFVCNPCHSKFHAFPDPTYPIKVATKRGPGWVDYIESHKRELKSDNRQELMEVINRYKINTE